MEQYNYDCQYIDTPLEISGRLEDPRWEEAAVIDNFMVPETLEHAISKTEARLLWDDDYLYVGFKAYDKDIFSYYTDHDSMVCDEDVLELFIKPHADKDDYYNFEINALNTMLDGHVINICAGGGRGHRWQMWNCEGFKSKVFIKGTINDPSIIDEYWQLEMAMPFKSLPTLNGRKPQPNDVWKFHLSRLDYSVHLPKGVELSSCAPLSIADFHHFQDWIPLTFVKE
jgi:Carbohydrate family 9 binding domain-like